MLIENSNINAIHVEDLCFACKYFRSSIEYQVFNKFIKTFVLQKKQSS